MGSLLSAFRRGAEGIAAIMMAALFLTFVLQIAVRYSARIPAISDALPFLEPALYGWTLEFCLALWVWLVFFGCAFVVRTQDHVSFDILYDAVRPGTRRVFAILAGVILATAFAAAILPTWDKFHILRLKKTATLSALFGNGIRMRDVYAIYILFLVAIAGRYAWGTWRAIRHGAEPAPDTASVHRADE